MSSMSPPPPLSILCCLPLSVAALSTDYVFHVMFVHDGSQGNFFLHRLFGFESENS